jgi:TRAP-type uncharacterized transport system fused permease subunit
VLSLILSMIVCAVLGMGLPTTAAYIVAATAVAPALTGLGIAILPAHLFLMYFACISAITPPVAVASYAAADIAEENPIRVSMTAFKLGITGFILPFAFAFNPEYLVLDQGLKTVLMLLCAWVVSNAVAIGLQGYIEKKLNWGMRLLFLAIAAMAITPYVVPSLLAIVLFAIFYYGPEIQARRTHTRVAIDV